MQRLISLKTRLLSYWNNSSQFFLMCCTGTN